MLLQLLFALLLWSFDKDIILEKQTEFNSSSHMTIYTSQEKKNAYDIKTKCPFI